MATHVLAPSNLFAFIGSVVILVLLIRFLGLILIYLRPSGLHRYAHRSPRGEEPWAFVTGASDGIGRAFAQELAKNGFNVVLHGRRHEKLGRAVSQLQQLFPHRSFRILVADACNVGCLPSLNDERPVAVDPNLLPVVNFDAIRQELDDIHLTVLINNAGGGPTNPVCLSVMDSPEPKITGNISLNALFPLQLARALLPNMVRNAPSMVVNISTMADQGFPLIASYSASKAFIMAATRALRLEMKIAGQDVEVLGIRVGRVTGARGCKEPVSLFVPNAEIMARSALARSGCDSGIVVGYWAHAVQQLGAGLLSMLPRWVEDAVITDIMRKERESLDGGNNSKKLP
ncbi:short chain dehydrogenase/reductase [Pestalotiopsis sp. NC0098]|nr:short chain dehydrogenase/reductase [Pestalotiopsis sp. NC0098]